VDNPASALPQSAMTTLPPHPPTTIARLTTDEATARRLSDVMAEILPADEVAVSAFEADEAARQWAVEFVFEHAPDEAAFRALLARQADTQIAQSLIFETLQPKDWVAASLKGLAPVSAGRFLLHGAHDRAYAPVNRIAIEIEAALAFGTGHHGTTKGCLLAFDDLLKRRKAKRVTRLLAPLGAALPHKERGKDDILDIGTGTGVLAIAAARALRRKVLASDIDPIAVRVARENVRHNRVASYVTLFAAAGAMHGRFRRSGQHSLIFANILASPLKRMATPLARSLAPQGVIILSGLLPAHANAVIAAYRMQGLRLRRRYLIHGWVTLTMQRGR
jgi:ribosomal protein L11 methyltransferase